MNSKLQVIVLCEDDQHYHFARKYLQLRGVRRVIKKVAPPGDGSGSQFVIERYAREVKAYRGKNFMQIALVVFLDEDKQGFLERQNTLAAELEKSEELPRQANEKIAHFIPARNIETWFHYLAGHEDIDEKKDYKPNYRRGPYPSNSAKKLAGEICPSGLPHNAPSSLQHACEELQRLAL